MPKKPASTRATGHVLLQFGLVTVPISVYNGVDGSHGIKRNMFVTVPVMENEDKQKTAKVEKEDGTFEEVPVFEDHPVGYGNVDKTTGEQIPPGREVLKKIATEYGHVYVEDHEIEQLFETPSNSMVVTEFQPQTLFYQGHYVPKSLYFVEATKAAGKGGKKVPNVAAQNTLAVILAAMRANNAMAVVEFTTRGLSKPAVLLPNGTLWTVYHTDELREQRPLPEVDVPIEAAQVAFETYMKPMWGEQPLDLEDKRTALIQAYADEKAKAGDFGRSDEPEFVQETATGGLDLLAQLQASVDEAKKQREVG